MKVRLEVSSGLSKTHHVADFSRTPCKEENHIPTSKSGVFILSRTDRLADLKLSSRGCEDRGGEGSQERCEELHVEVKMVYWNVVLLKNEWDKRWKDC